ncbi:hypothetical protein [Streptomyces sp. CAI-85]|uniref:hypothetical protein n=1 Tax=Streptomyces sp. CAI-85 TaxID=1472662 RepID=UPI001587BA42|nr:hypothetical protein [Streptomyces sp. CAI-85]NUV61964.1 hypothetical protein [Streptomyces sp. CAI-85]
MQRYPSFLPPVDHGVSLSQADKPPRPGQSLVLSRIAEQCGWKTREQWHCEPGSYLNLIFMLWLGCHDGNRKLTYGVQWKRRQPTFDLGWWSRGEVVSCPAEWPKIKRLSGKAIQRMQWVISANDVSGEVDATDHDGLLADLTAAEVGISAAQWRAWEQQRASMAAQQEGLPPCPACGQETEAVTTGPQGSRFEPCGQKIWIRP